MKTIVHISDLHFKTNRHEDQGVVLDAFFQDLEKEIDRAEETFIAFSGDIVMAGAQNNLYVEFSTSFLSRLNDIGIDREHIICVPGNHDASHEYVQKHRVLHDGIVQQDLDETTFNDFLANEDTFLVGKFENYLKNIPRRAALGILENHLSGIGSTIHSNIGVYCANSALCSSASLADDKGKLCIDTRSIHRWISTTDSRFNILIMHHPLSWLSPWSRKEMKTILRNHFCLFLSGHVHDQDYYHSTTGDSSLVTCSAPPLFTNKFGPLGYALIDICPDQGLKTIRYRQWSKHRSFVLGTGFSNNESGEVDVGRLLTVSNPEIALRLGIQNQFKSDRNSAMFAFSNRSAEWVEPDIKQSAEIPRQFSSEQSESLPSSDLIKSGKSYIIKAPPQFGLTCLGLHLRYLAATQDKRFFWAFLNASTLKTQSIEKEIKKQLKSHNLSDEALGGIIVDSWFGRHKKDQRLLQKIDQLFPSLPFIVLQTTDDSQGLVQSIDVTLSRKVEGYYLWSLSRNKIRDVVANYNAQIHVGDEDAVVSKVVSDLEALNLHRTALNCLTLLKVSEIDFDDSPVNRTEMIHRVLFLLFNMDNIPSYRTQPDLVDCEYVLGRFSETLIREGRCEFSRVEFVDIVTRFCKQNLIDLDVEAVFDTLFVNRILVADGSMFRFRFSYWIYYFGAHRMHQDAEFSKYILSDMRYASYPEIIEFYTGIDRRRVDALEVLIEDIRRNRETVATKCGLSERLDIFSHMRWRPSEELIRRIYDEIGDEVKNSNLPDSVKDQFADRSYDRTKPYDQSIGSLFDEYSLVSLMHAVKAGARALRNSDYAGAEHKRKMLIEIASSLEQLSFVLVAISPILVEKGSASFEGANFILSGQFSKEKGDLLTALITSIPTNVVNWYRNDLFSRKLGTLLIDQIGSEERELRRHMILLLLISERPKLWKKTVQDYIAKNDKDSFFLMDVFHALRREFQFGYLNPSNLRDLGQLIKASLAKHEFGIKNPGPKAIKKISDKNLPDRRET